MNDTLNINETVAMPFPHDNYAPALNEKAIAVSREVLETSRDINNVLESAGNVHKLVMAHYINLKTGEYGIERLIESILKANSAVFLANVGSTELRAVAIASSLFASEIIDAVQTAFGKERYPYATIHTYLSHFMVKSSKIGKIKLSNNEDSNRTCCKPRQKYFLLEKITPIIPA